MTERHSKRPDGDVQKGPSPKQGIGGLPRESAMLQRLLAERQSRRPAILPPKQSEGCARGLACENLKSLNNYIFIISYYHKGLCFYIYEVIEDFLFKFINIHKEQY